MLFASDLSRLICRVDGGWSRVSWRSFNALSILLLSAVPRYFWQWYFSFARGCVLVFGLIGVKNESALIIDWDFHVDSLL